VTLESFASQPFVVITNECQYEEADGMLLRQELFGSPGGAAGNSTPGQVPGWMAMIGMTGANQLHNMEVAWPLVANRLHKYFMRATRQDLLKPTRFLAPDEIAFLHLKFFGGRNSVPAKMFDEFWSWFGKGVQKLRYQRYLCQMWQSGYKKKKKKKKFYESFF
jgi:hypothetical protein